MPPCERPVISTTGFIFAKWQQKRNQQQQHDICGGRDSVHLRAMVAFAYLHSLILNTHCWFIFLGGPYVAVTWLLPSLSGRDLACQLLVTTNACMQDRQIRVRSFLHGYFGWLVIHLNHIDALLGTHASDNLGLQSWSSLHCVWLLSLAYALLSERGCAWPSQQFYSSRGTLAEGQPLQPQFQPAKVTLGIDIEDPKPLKKRKRGLGLLLRGLSPFKALGGALVLSVALLLLLAADKVAPKVSSGCIHVHFATGNA